MDQQFTYLSFEHVKMYPSIWETAMPKMHLSWRFMKIGLLRSSRSFSKRRSRRSSSSFSLACTCRRCFSKPLTRDAGSTSRMSGFLSKRSVEPGSFPAMAAMSLIIFSLSATFSCCFFSKVSPFLALSSSLKISRSFLAIFKKSFSESSSAEEGLKVDSLRQDMVPTTRRPLNPSGRGRTHQSTLLLRKRATGAAKAATWRSTCDPHTKMLP
mmetsp:Transcript_99479/g.176540  ORF Transcript_99479/g.176540 Transcript_99479/m.176540 type:complete len:212 (+) Transcript_99479:1159-1794(+)